MAITRITGQDIAIHSASETAVTFPGATTAGHLLLCIAEAYVGTGTAPTITGWTLITSGVVYTSNQSVYLFAKIAAGTETTITPTPGSQTTFYALGLCEYSGVANPLTQDGTAGGAGPSGTSVTTFATPAITTAAASSLIFVVCGINQALSSPSWAHSTLILSNATGAGFFCGQYLPGVTETSFTDTASWTTVGYPSTLIAGFSAAASVSSSAGFFEFF